jgi:hypothetical protein
MVVHLQADRRKEKDKHQAKLRREMDLPKQLGRVEHPIHMHFEGFQT